MPMDGGGKEGGLDSARQVCLTNHRYFRRRPGAQHSLANKRKQFIWVSENTQGNIQILCKQRFRSSPGLCSGCTN